MMCFSISLGKKVNMIALINRNLLIYLRDKGTVFFSLLSVFIVVGLYILFLAQLQIDTIESSVPVVIPNKDMSWLINSWIVAGILSIIPITSCLGSFGTMVSDREKKIMKDFRSSPLKPFIYPLSAVCSSGIIAYFMSLLAFVLYALYIYIDTGYSFSSKQIGSTLGLMLLTSVFACCLMGFIASLFRTSSSFIALNIVIGTVIGFINGVYVPLGILPDAVQAVVKILPFGHSAVSFRQVLMPNALDQVFGNYPSEVVDSYRETYGLAYWINGSEMGLWVSVTYLTVVAVLAFLLFVVSYSKQNQTK